MEIDLIRKDELVNYAKNAIKFFEYHIPITTERAISQSRNPDAKEDDVLLIVAREGNKLLSFIGVYPGIVQNNKDRRIYWISCWWKAPGISSETSSRVLRKFLEFSKHEVGVPHLPPHIIKVLEKNNISVKGREGLMIRFRSGIHPRSLQRSLKGNYNNLVHILRKTGLTRVMDNIINTLKVNRFSFIPEIENQDFKVYLDVPGEDYFSFIHSNFRDYITLPHRKNIEWILNYPWLVTPGNMDKAVVNKYHFSYVSEKFYHFFPVLRKEGEIVAAGFFICRDGAVKSLFLFVKSSWEDEYFAEILKFIQKDGRNHTLITYEKPFVQFLKGKLKNRLKLNTLNRYVGIGNKKYLNLNPTDADGDSCFT